MDALRINDPPLNARCALDRIYFDKQFMAYASETNALHPKGAVVYCAISRDMMHHSLFHD